MKRQLFSFLIMGLPFSLSAAEDLESIKQQFIGDYELVRYVTFSEDGSERDMGYIGRLSYDRFDNIYGYQPFRVGKGYVNRYNKIRTAEKQAKTKIS